MSDKDSKIKNSLLYQIDELDKHYSMLLMQSNSKPLNALLCIWAHFFNRKQILISLTITWILGTFTYNTWLPNLGFKPIERTDLSFTDSIRLGCALFWIYGFGLIVLVIFAQIFKYSIRRPRPNPLPNAVRWGLDLRGGEDGTFSMPSGDSAAATTFCWFIYSTLNMPAIFVIVPLVMAGRVFYFCHWIGDTIMGVLLGVFSMSSVFFLIMNLVPFL